MVEYVEQFEIFVVATTWNIPWNTSDQPLRPAQAGWGVLLHPGNGLYGNVVGLRAGHHSPG
jgi:hypothetical protein